MFFFFTAIVGVGLLAGPARAAPWEDATAATIGTTAEWSNKVEIADIDGDGRPDILFANGAGYANPEDPEQNRAFLNQGPGMPFLEVSEDVFSGEPDFTRAIKVRDLDGDGAADILVANTFETQSRLYLGDGEGGFIDATDKLPQEAHSFGDVELGDVDGDGDLDAVLADWGPGAANQTSGRTRLWLGDGAGNFTDVTETQMPDVLVAWSWELEFADVDNDFDLDVLVSCKSCTGSYMFVNDGAGNFTDASDKLPQFANNYEFEPIDLTGDGFIDLITINDGPQGREHVFVNDGAGGFTDATAELWPDSDNIPGDDNMVAFLDVESDGDADFVIAGLFGSDDRLMTNSGDGHLTVADAFMPANSQGTLGIAVGDLDGDKKIDVVLSEGEAPQSADRVFLGVDVPVDTAGPRVTQVTLTDGVVYARIHDNKSPVMPFDFQSVVLVAGGTETPMYWYGEALWRGSPEGGAESGQLCATDAAGNETCVAFGEEPSETDSDGTTAGTSGPDPTTDATSDAPTTGNDPTTGSAATTDAPGTTDGTGDDSASTGDTGGLDDDSGCGCRQAPPSSGLFALGLFALLTRRRRR